MRAYWLPLVGLAAAVSARRSNDSRAPTNGATRGASARGTARSRPLARLGLSAERFDIDDPPAFLARDLRPVVRVGRIRQVLVLFELLPHRPEEIVELDALGAGLDEALEGQSLRPAHHGFDHRSRGEVLEVEHLLVTVRIGDLEEAILLVAAVHLVHRG